MTQPGRPFIIHVTADHPDTVQPNKTPVIQRLAGLVESDFRQKILSLNRRSPPKSSWAWPRLSLEAASESDALDALIYTAPPAGIHHRRLLVRLGEALAARIAKGPRPDLLVGHKLTVEGFAVARAASLLGVPYALSVQGNTDQRILQMRPDLHRFLRPIFHEASHVFPFTPWALRALEDRLGKRAGGTTLLPCPMARDTMIAPKTGGAQLVSAFHLRHADLKNLPAMARALRSVREGGTDAQLVIIGGGTIGEVAAAHSHGAEGMTFEGALPNDAIAARFNAARGFILPSLRESFGLVFIEALFAGLPIAFPRGAALDGYFADCPFALPVDARDDAAIARAMRELHDDEERLKQALAEWQGSEAAKRFTRPAIGAALRRGLMDAAGMAGTA